MTSAPDRQEIAALITAVTQAGVNSPVVGGVDTHKDLHVAAVVDHLDRLLGVESFPTTRQGYRQMLSWMQSFGELERIGIECSGSYGAGLLRYMQAAGVAVLDVTAPDRHDRRRRGKNDDFDAESAAHAAYAERRTVTIGVQRPISGILPVSEGRSPGLNPFETKRKTGPVRPQHRFRQVKVAEGAGPGSDVLHLKTLFLLYETEPPSNQMRHSRCGVAQSPSFLSLLAPWP